MHGLKFRENKVLIYIYSSRDIKSNWLGIWLLPPLKIQVLLGPKSPKSKKMDSDSFL